VRELRGWSTVRNSDGLRVYREEGRMKKHNGRNVRALQSMFVLQEEGTRRGMEVLRYFVLTS